MVGQASQAGLQPVQRPRQEPVQVYTWWSSLPLGSRAPVTFLTGLWLISALCPEVSAPGVGAGPGTCHPFVVHYGICIRGWFWALCVSREVTLWVSREASVAQGQGEMGLG